MDGSDGHINHGMISKRMHLAPLWHVLRDS
jgi:hypothetical protein